MVRTPEENEKFVRKHWPGVEVECDFGWHFWFGGKVFGCPYLFIEEQSKDIPWAAAAEFTEQQKETITLAEFDMAYLEGCGVYTMEQGESKERILAREQAALESLKKGMRP